jgi:hypothetical protein
MGSSHELPLPFVEALTGLKQHGSNLLIVGSVPKEVHDDICKRMLGDNIIAPRCRVIVLPNANSESDWDNMSNFRCRTPKLLDEEYKNAESFDFSENVGRDWEQV